VKWRRRFYDACAKGSDSLREQGRAGGGLLFVFFYIFLRGSGRWSIDAMIEGKSLGGDDGLAASETPASTLPGNEWYNRYADPAYWPYD